MVDRMGKTLPGIVLAMLIAGGVAIAPRDATEAVAAQTSATTNLPKTIPIMSRTTVWRPGPDGEQKPLWPSDVAIQKPESDEAEKVGNGSGLVAGRPWHWAGNVSRPTMTIYRPKGRNNHAAVMVLPGGGYQAMDLEGTEVCDWVTSKGMTCVVLKYRVPQNWRPKGRDQAPKPQLALQDAQRAMGLLRRDAASLGVDPHKVGVIGFSAGGHLAAAVSNAGPRTYEPIDAADREPSRPDFAVLLYPGHLWDEASATTSLKLAPWVQISPDAPPTLLIQTVNDPTDDIRHSLAYGLALKSAGVPIEMHFYAEGGHAFGLRPTPYQISRWPALVETWLHTIKVR